MKTAYLGDGVYATFDTDAGMLWLDCRAQLALTIGPADTPAIAIEPSTWKSLVKFLADCTEGLEHG